MARDILPTRRRRKKLLREAHRSGAGKSRAHRNLRDRLTMRRLPNERHAKAIMEDLKIDVHLTTKCTTEMIQAFVELLLEGMPVDKSCAFLGIARQTYYKWVENGDEYIDTSLDGGEPPDHLEIYACFVIAVRRAQAEWQRKVIGRSFQDRHNVSWVRDMTLLERRDRENWSRNERISIDDAAPLPDEAYL